jgi:hypothetical protein
MANINYLAIQHYYTTVQKNSISHWSAYETRTCVHDNQVFFFWSKTFRGSAPQDVTGLMLVAWMCFVATT